MSSRNSAIVHLRKRGYTLERIGNVFDMSVEGVRQVLIKEVGSTANNYIARRQLSNLAGCSAHPINTLRNKGLITPLSGEYRRHGALELYSPTEVKKALLLLERKCANPRCATSIPRTVSRKFRYCPSCIELKCRNPYAFYTADFRRQKNRNQLKYNKKMRILHYAETRYIVIRGTILPIDTVIQATGCKNSKLILLDGMTIPISFVKKLGLPG